MGGGGGGGGGGREAGHNYTLPNAAHRSTFLSSQDGLSWHLRALHCKFQMYKDGCSRETSS